GASRLAQMVLPVRVAFPLPPGIASSPSPQTTAYPGRLLPASAAREGQGERSAAKKLKRSDPARQSAATPVQPRRARLNDVFATARYPLQLSRRLSTSEA